MYDESISDADETLFPPLLHIARIHMPTAYIPVSSYKLQVEFRNSKFWLLPQNFINKVQSSVEALVFSIL